MTSKGLLKYGTLFVVGMALAFACIGLGAIIGTMVK